MKNLFACPHCSGPIMLSTVVTPIAPPNPTHDLPQQALEMAAALLADVNMPQPHQPPPDQPLAEPSASAKLPQTQLPRRKGGAAAASASAMKQTPKAKERPMLAQPVRPFPTMPAGFVPRRVPVPDHGKASKSLDDPWGLRPDHAGGPRPAQPIGAAPPSQPASAAAPAALGVWAAPAEQAAPPRRSPRVDPLQRPADWLPTPQELLDAEAEMHQRREALAARQAQEPSSADASLADAAWPQRQPRPEQDRSRSPAPLRSRSSGILDSAWTQILHAVVKKELHQD